MKDLVCQTISSYAPKFDRIDVCVTFMLRINLMFVFSGV